MTDLRLGDESGLQFLEWLRGKEELQELPVIVLSGSPSPKDISAAKSMGVLRVWHKPRDPAVLQSMIAQLAEEFCSGAFDSRASGKKAHLARR